jgi:hypothetical protein
MVAGMQDFGVIHLNGIFTGMTQGPLFGLFIGAMYLPFLNDWVSRLYIENVKEEGRKRKIYC